MIEARFGPWKQTDWEHFVGLDVELRPPPDKVGTNALRGLLNIGKPSPLVEAANALRREKQFDEAWAIRCAHPVYKILEEDLHFRQAWKVFERARARAKDGKLADITAPLRFLREYVRAAGYAYEVRDLPGLSKYGPNIERRRSAISHAKALTKLLALGINFENYANTKSLQVLLETLIVELEAIKRKPYGGSRRLDRSILKHLAFGLISECELKSAAVVTHFARMVGLPCEPKTAQRYTDEAARQMRSILAAALSSAAAAHGQNPQQI